MRTFEIHRPADDIHGTGKVAEGICYTDGSVAMKAGSLAYYDTVDSLVANRGDGPLVVWHAQADRVAVTHWLRPQSEGPHTLVHPLADDHQITATPDPRRVTCQKCLIAMGSTGVAP